jgi:hypothetical protein
MTAAACVATLPGPKKRFIPLPFIATGNTGVPTEPLCELIAKLDSVLSEAALFLPSNRIPMIAALG